MDAAEWKQGLTGDRQAKLRRAHFCPKESLSTMALTDMIRLPGSPLLSEWERWPEHSAQNDEASDAMVRMTGSHSLLLLFLFSDFLPLVKIRDKSLVQPQEKIRKKLPTAELRQEGSKSLIYKYNRLRNKLLVRTFEVKARTNNIWDLRRGDVINYFDNNLRTSSDKENVLHYDRFRQSLAGDGAIYC